MTGVEPVDVASGFGEGRVTQPDDSFTVLSTLIKRCALVLLSRNWIGSILAAAASSLIIDS